MHADAEGLVVAVDAGPRRRARWMRWLTAAGLAGAVPATAAWKLTGLPRAPYRAMSRGYHDICQ